MRFSDVMKGAAALVASAVVWSAPVLGDDFVARVNAFYSDIGQSKRSDLVLLPAMARTAEAPGVVNTVDEARLLPVGATGWSEAAAWASAAPQQAALAALRQVTAGTDPRTSFEFGQPYGIEGVAPELIRAGLYTELGSPPLLAAAQHKYMTMLDRLECLVNVEATRLAAEGKPADAMDLLVSWLFFGRQMADREFHAEAAWGLRTIDITYERLRDVAYVDFRNGKKLTPDQLKAVIERIGARQTYLDLARMQLPRADHVAAEQLIALTMTERAGPDERRFPTTMARVATADHPLRLFSESAQWRTAAAGHANWFDTNERLRGIWNDWNSRWGLDWFDRRMAAVQPYKTTTGARFAVITQAMPDMWDLFDLRQIARVEWAGTRTALALLGSTYANNTLPATITVARPRFVAQLDDDPLNANRGPTAPPPMQFFVPMRDLQRGQREEPRPHELEVVSPGRPNFVSRLRDDVFVLYSVGSDNAPSGARRVQNTIQRVEGADYLIWPPVLSLYRQHLSDSGEMN